MSTYSVHVFCDECSEVHPFGISLALDDGPADKASIGDTYAGKELPPKIASLMNNMVICPKTKRPTLQKNNDQVFLVAIEEAKMGKVLREIATRLATLKTTSGPETTPLTFAVGAVFALLKAEELGFQFGREPGRALRVWTEARLHCEEVGKGGVLPTSGQWLAGYYYNDGIIRIAVAFEHLIRHETEFHDHAQLKDLQAKARDNGFLPEWLTSWGHVFDELSAIRHRNKVYDGPDLEPEGAVKALVDLTDALEWACARRAQMVPPKAMEESV